VQAAINNFGTLKAARFKFCNNFGERLTNPAQNGKSYFDSSAPNNLKRKPPFKLCCFAL
jgi:hypothetical protein